MKKNPDSYERKPDRLLSKKIFRIMKITVFLMMITVCQLWAVESYSQSAKISLKLEDAKIADALRAIEEQTEFYFLYSPKLIDVEREVNIDVENASVDMIVAQLFGNDISKVIYDRQIVLTPKDRPFENEQRIGLPEQILQKKIEGQVVDADGNPIPGVTVVVKGTTIGVITDIDGKYSITTVTQGGKLVFSSVGMKTVEVDILDQQTIDVVMKEDIIGLEEVVVTGYSTEKKADLTGAISIVKSDVISQTPTANIVKSIQGKIPGVHISSNGGDPTESIGIQIRGITTLNGATPLFIVDGAPTTMNMRDFNPGDIESIQVLKDAASASIYGSRAAAGVVLIQTKKGEKGPVKIKYEGSVGIELIPNTPVMCNTEQYGIINWQSAVNDNIDPNAMSFKYFSYEWHLDENGIPVLDKVIPVKWLDASIDDQDNPENNYPSGDVDWMKEFHRIGIVHNHQITLTSGTDNSKSLLSMNYFRNDGTQKYSYYNRVSLRLNNEYSPTKWLTFGENALLSYAKFRSNNGITAAQYYPPILSMYDLDGVWGGTATKLGGGASMINFYRTAAQNVENATHYPRVNADFYAEINILKNLKFKSDFALYAYMQYERDITHTFEEAGGLSSDYNEVSNNEYNAINYSWANTLIYKLDLGKNKFDFLLGTEAFADVEEGFSALRDGLVFEDRDFALLSVANGTGTGVGSSYSEYRLLSYFGKINYSYNATYIAAATIRYDGSSKFGANNKFGFFPAFSAGWRIKNEVFLKDVDAISELKLRASWGINGNQNPIPSGATTSNYTVNVTETGYALSGGENGPLTTGYIRSTNGNPNLRWEQTVQYNFGLDFGVLDNRLTGSVDFFKKYTEGMLFKPSVPATMGVGAAQWINAANISNIGLELLLTYASDPNKDFTFEITGVFSNYKNTVNDLPAVAINSYGGNGLLENIIGHPLNSIYGYVADGLFETQEEVNTSAQQSNKGLGRIRYKDLDGSGKITSAYDRTWLGCYDPDFEAGLNFTAKWKDFDASMFWQGSFGADVVNYWKQYSDFYGLDPYRIDNNHSTRILDAWSLTNTTSTIPALSRKDNGETIALLSSYYVESGSYLKLRNLELGYSIPKRISNRIGMSNCRFSINCNNLITLSKWWGDNKFTGVDPEYPNFSYLQSTTIFLGLNVTF
jgi:TonB-linked SusC/RagA family outer membrane protein